MRRSLWVGLVGAGLLSAGAGAQEPRVKVTTRRPNAASSPTPKPTPRAQKAAPARARRPARPVRRSARPAVRRSAARPAPRAPAWEFRYAGVDGVSYHVAPRAPEARGNPRTADLILKAEPTAARVFFYLNGGAMLRDTTQAVVKDRRVPSRRRLYLLAVAPELSGRAGAFVPLQAGHITTVRFRFQGEVPAPAAPE